jgi:hypothetical protein
MRLIAMNLIPDADRNLSGRLQICNARWRSKLGARRVLGQACVLSALLRFGTLSAGAFMLIGQNFTGSKAPTDSTAQPADADGAAGPFHFVEFINGRFSVYDKTTGQRLQSMTDLQFWAKAGVPTANGFGVTDPRIAFDPYAQRWFASMIDLDLSAPRQTNNRFLIAVSASADPTGGWHGFAFTADPVNGDFADFPTLGVDAEGVYLAGDMFTPKLGLHIGSALVSIPKSDLLLPSPTIANRTSFGILVFNARGHILQPAMTTGGAASGESVLAAGNLGLDSLSHTSLVLSAVENAASTAAQLSSFDYLPVPDYEAAPAPVQPGGSTNLDGGDGRLSACVRRVGDWVYAVHSVQVSSRAGLRWYRFDVNTPANFQSGTIADATQDLFYPSIAANELGTAVIACNGSSASSFVSCYAAVGQTVNGLLQFGNLALLKGGVASYRVTDSTGISRWGDYSTTTVDPTDPNRFWTIQLYPASATAWATQITEIITGFSLSVQRNGTNLQISWPTSATGFILQSAPSLSPTAAWTPVATASMVAGNRATVAVPITQRQSYFRLSQ